MHKFTLTLFGGFHLADASGKPLNPATRKAKALLAWLALNPSREHLREKLASILWPDSDEAQARHSLRQTLVELHRIVPETAGVLHTTRESVRLDNQILNVDALAFNAALARGDEGSLDQAIHLYQGELLEGCNPRSDMFEDWLANYRNDYSVRATSTMRQRLAALLQQQDYPAAILTASRLLAIDPLQEPAYQALMQASAGLGDTAAALNWYKRCQRLLQHELGVAPSPETQAVHRKLSSNRATHGCPLPIRHQRQGW